nr:MAG TPA: hypothetical protein [Caudoviricetes sp.]
MHAIIQKSTKHITINLLKPNQTMLFHIVHQFISCAIHSPN